MTVIALFEISSGLQDHHHSSVVVHEEDPIVQLSYAYKTLLISSTSRALLCYTSEDNRCQQIGQQARKVYGMSGFLFNISKDEHGSISNERGSFKEIVAFKQCKC